MADIARRGDLDVRVANPTTQTVLAVTTNGDDPTDLLRVGGTAITLGQKTMAASLPVTIASNQTAIPVTVQTPAAGTSVFKTGTLVTTAVTADQVILTYTVTAGKTFYLQYIQVSGYRTTLPGNTNPLWLGAMSVETPSGTKIITVDRFHAPTNDAPFTLNAPISAGTTVRVVVTPSAVTSTTWRANFGGYEI